MEYADTEMARGAIRADYCRLMARYGAWQNRSQMGAAGRLDDADRFMDRGAFFRSIQGTFSHFLWSDAIWMSRLAGTPPPDVGLEESPDYLSDWSDFSAERARLDAVIRDWAEALRDMDLAGDLTFHSASAQRSLTRPWSVCVAHFFNHQTHHRGQIHAMLTAAGVAPGATDIILMPSGY